ncbi:MAG: hypothetical protein JRJ58_22680 [Deltaproteobacteria bacterium]|nr:hypothetical protein [Deltaproteobacteria bacterium]
MSRHDDGDDDDNDGDAVQFASSHPELFSSRTGPNGPGVPISELGPIQRVIAIARPLRGGG